MLTLKQLVSLVFIVTGIHLITDLAWVYSEGTSTFGESLIKVMIAGPMLHIPPIIIGAILFNTKRVK